ncbi:kunitz/Bovine pancreatic trypsin inhibitor domain-containing protein [Loa loa]|uniref:Kunitz/Bovine pancreatic trypsin inhibitor domain-containing protein n=1 Tax=Loa loa TaxID=7209 RepID=A0A1S0UHG8_LOALO|nr:kunitz/Bovine pancreatic trypsin inhibitor domain-containing protein [Loa loa]EJD74337.1 kunitz/Bovine pancreatic trypsin inhibitor domain-containing protein [Loa loa]
MNREFITHYHSTINACTKHIIISGARGAHLKHAVVEQNIPSSDEEFSHDSITMHINIPEHKGQKFVASNIENEVTLNKFDTVTDSVDNNAINDIHERSNLSPIIIPKEWNMDPDGYRYIDKTYTTLLNSHIHESLTITTPSTTLSSNGPVKSAMENAAPSLASVSIISSTAGTAPTSISSTISINHSVTAIFASISTMPISSKTVEKSGPISSSQKLASESKIVNNRGEESVEPSIQSPPQILSQPIPPGKSWLYDGLQSIINSQILPEQHSQQEELSDKKLSFGSFDPIGTFALATFNTALNNNDNSLPITTTVMNTSRKPLISTNDPAVLSTSIQKLSPNVIDTTVGSNEFQTKKSIELSEKSMKGSEENHYFNADSSIFMNAPSFQNQTHTVVSGDWTGNSNINIMTKQLSFASNGTKETEKEESEGKQDLSSHNIGNTLIVKPGNDVLHSFIPDIQETSTEVHTSLGQSDSQSDMVVNQDHRINTVGHRFHSLKHQQSLPENLSETTRQQFIAVNDTQVAQNTSFQTTDKQGENEEVLRDQTTINTPEEEMIESETSNAHEEEMTEFEISNKQNISNSQVTSLTTPDEVTHPIVTSLQQLQPEDDTCVLPPDAGTCHDYVLRWFHNSQTAKCEQFSYGSCGGNSNNFLNRHACETKCTQDEPIKSQLPERCTYRKDEGYGNGYNVKWYFNVRNLRCEQMVYKGEGGNSNQFETLGECQTFCISLDDEVHAMNTTTKQIAHSLKTTSIDLLQQDFAAASHDQENQHVVSTITGTDKMSKRQHHIHAISQNAPENHHHRIISDNDSIGDEEIQQISSKQHHTSSSISAQPFIPVTPAQLIPQRLDGSTRKTMTMEESPSPELSSLTLERKIIDAKTFGATIVNISNDDHVDLPRIVEEISQAPSCPNGLKPMQHADGRPMMCLPGRNQCTGNSLCYFNGVDFFCCPNADDPYDEHVFGGYGGDEVKRGYKSVKKRPINGNELIVRKLRLKRQAQIITNRPLAINTAARIDSKLPKQSLAKALFTVNGSNSRQVNNICMQNVNTGKCTEAHLRFFYDPRVGTCRLFYYSGCGGNENNFATEDECRQRCKNDKIHIENTPPGSCPFGEPPLGDNAPVICGDDAGSFECPKGYYCRMGPPNVCCLEKFLPVLEKALVTKKNQKNIRFSPRKPNDDIGYQPEEGQKGSEVESSQSLIVPTNICPDGSDALVDDSTQQPLKCGSGYDGQSLCPVGYYCSIDSEKNGRLCCQLGVMGVKIPPPPKIPPYFGLRPSNPGEVLPRGSLPSDYITQKHQETGISNVAESSEGYRSHLVLGGNKLATNVRPIIDSRAPENEAIDHSGNLVPVDQAADSSRNLVPSDSKLQDDVYGRMMLKSNDQTFRTQASPETETNEVQIDVGEMKDPFESLEYAQKTTSDRSICLLKPNEGRTCRENESPPRTNLQYFYSSRDKRCKLYFYRGCGGSQNRFDTKRHCELTCAGM